MRLGIGILVALLGSVTLAGEVVQIQRGKDNTLYQNSNGSLSNGSEGGLFFGRNRGGMVRRALLAFSLTSISTSATVNSATLKLVLSNPNNQNSESRTVSVHRVLQDWGEGLSNADGEGGQRGSQTARRFRSRHDGASAVPVLAIDYRTQVEEEGSLVLIFPQFVNGQTGDDLNKSRIILRNNSDLPAAGKIRFRASHLGAPSQPTALPIGGKMFDFVDYELEPWGTLDFETDGTGTLTTGVVEVFASDGSSSALDSHISDSDLEGTEVFTILGGFVSVGSSTPRSSQQIYVSRNAGEGTGLAVYNPDDEETTILDLILLDDLGMVKATEQISILPREHMALFVDQDPLFEDFFRQNPGDFEGTLNIHVSAGEDVSIVALLQKKPSGALIAVSPSSDAFLPQP